MIKPDGQILVIFGASGDLTKRKLLPSLYELFARDMLPENFVILGDFLPGDSTAKIWPDCRSAA